MKLRCLILSVCLLLLTVSCGKSAPQVRSDNLNTESIRAALVTNGEDVNDNENDTAIWNALVRVQDELGVVSSYVIPEETDKKGYQKAFDSCYKDEHNFIWMSETPALDELLDSSRKHPEIGYAVVGMRNPDPDKYPNVTGVLFREPEGAFVAGYTAAAAGNSGTVGFIGGDKEDKDCLYAFKAGAVLGGKEAGKGEIKVLEDTIKAGSDKAYQITSELCQDGADVVFSMAVNADPLVLKATSDAGAKFISTKLYKDQPAVLMTVANRVDNVVYTVMKDYLSGKRVNNIHFGLSDGGIKLAFPADDSKLQKQAEAVRDRIISGEISVPVDKKGYNQFVDGL